MIKTLTTNQNPPCFKGLDFLKLFSFYSLRCFFFLRLNRFERISGLKKNSSSRRRERGGITNELN